MVFTLLVCWAMLVATSSWGVSATAPSGSRPGSPTTTARSSSSVSSSRQCSSWSNVMYTEAWPRLADAAPIPTTRRSTASPPAPSVTVSPTAIAISCAVQASTTASPSRSGKRPESRVCQRSRGRSAIDPTNLPAACSSPARSGRVALPSTATSSPCWAA